MEIVILGIVQFKKDIYSEDGASWTIMSIPRSISIVPRPWYPSMMIVISVALTSLS